jgi:hypothetical protein
MGLSPENISVGGFIDSGSKSIDFAGKWLIKGKY